MMAKQSIGPVQAYQVDQIKNRVLLFETRCRLYRQQFRNSEVFSA